MFIHIFDKTDRIINLASVSSIALLKDDHRVVFNMAYSCTLSSMGTKKDGVKLADYIYWDNYTDDELNALINSQYIKQHFISFKGHNRLINKDHIASIKVDTHRKRIIVNIKCSIRLKQGADLSSDFIFVDAADDKQLNEYKAQALALVQE